MCSAVCLCVGMSLKQHVDRLIRYVGLAVATNLQTTTQPYGHTRWAKKVVPQTHDHNAVKS